MSTDLFGVVDLDAIKKKKRKTPLKIHLPLGKVCVGSKDKFTCRSVPYSPNFLNRKHWAVQARWKKAWEEEIYGRWLEEKPKWKEYEFPLDFKVAISISVFCIKAQDEDNSYASFKGVIDGLIKCGIIKNDTIDHVTTSLQFIPVKTRKAEHIELIIKKHVRKY